MDLNFSCSAKDFRCPRAALCGGCFTPPSSSTLQTSPGYMEVVEPARLPVVLKATALELVSSKLNSLFTFFRRTERGIFLFNCFFNSKFWEEIKEYLNLLHLGLGAVLVLQQEASDINPQPSGRCNLVISRRASTILNPNPSNMFYLAEQVALPLLRSCIRRAWA